METLGAIKGAGAVAQSTAPPPRLMRAAHEFEAQMMRELMDPLTGGSSMSGDEDETGDGSGGALKEFASGALGEALSRGGGFGIANRIVNEIGHSGNQPAPGQVTSKVHSNTVMRALK